MKNKQAQESLKVFKDIISEGRICRACQMDEGNEFKGVFSQFLDQNKIGHYSTSESGVKAAVAERVIRTLKERLYRLFTYKGNKNYTKDLPKVVASYNNSWHRTIKMTPTQVCKENELQVFANLYYDPKTPEIKYKFKVGDYVRISVEKTLLEKGYTANFSKEIFLIDFVLTRVPPVYKLKALDGQKVKGICYAPELVLVSPIEFPYDTFEATDKPNGKFLIVQLNGSDTRSKSKLLDKETFLK